MSVDWEVKTLGEIATIKGGKRVPKGYKLEIEPTNYPYIRVTNFNANGTIDLHNLRYISENVFQQIRNYTISSNDLYMSIAGTIGKTGIIPKELNGANLTENACKLMFKSNIEPKYVYYFTKSDDFQMQAGLRTRIMAMPKLALSRLSTIHLPIPPIEEQRRIVAMLDEELTAVSTIINNTERNLKNGRELFASALQDVFTKTAVGWEEKTLAQIAITFGRGKSKHRPRNAKKLYGGKYPFIQTGDIRNCDHYITKYLQTYNEVGLAQSKLWPKGTICITIAANIAETGILTFDACFPDSVIGIDVNPQYAISGFVEYLLQSFKTRLQAKGKGSAQANINMGTFKNEFFPFPPVEEQHAIVAHLDALAAETQRLEAITQQKLAALNELKQSILQQAFKN